GRAAGACRAARAGRRRAAGSRGTARSGRAALATGARGAAGAGRPAGPGGPPRAGGAAGPRSGGALADGEGDRVLRLHARRGDEEVVGAVRQIGRRGELAGLRRAADLRRHGAEVERLAEVDVGAVGLLEPDDGVVLGHRHVVALVAAVDEAGELRA